jgi:hypothetical protein
MNEKTCAFFLSVKKRFVGNLKKRKKIVEKPINEVENLCTRKMSGFFPYLFAGI